MKGVKIPPLMLAQITPGEATVIRATGISAMVAGDVRREATGGRVPRRVQIFIRGVT